MCHWWAIQVATHVSDLGSRHKNGPHQDQIFDNPSAVCLVLWAKKMEGSCRLFMMCRTFSTLCFPHPLRPDSSVYGIPDQNKMTRQSIACLFSSTHLPKQLTCLIPVCVCVCVCVRVCFIQIMWLKYCFFTQGFPLCYCTSCVQVCVCVCVLYKLCDLNIVFSLKVFIYVTALVVCKRVKAVHPKESVFWQICNSNCPQEQWPECLCVTIGNRS